MNNERNLITEPEPPVQGPEGVRVAHSLPQPQADLPDDPSGTTTLGVMTSFSAL